MRLSKEWPCILRCNRKSEYQTFPCRHCIYEDNWTLCIRCHIWFNPTEKSTQEISLIRLYLLCPQCGVYKLRRSGRVYWRRFIPEWTSYRQMRLHTERAKELISKNLVQRKGTKWL